MHIKTVCPQCESTYQVDPGLKGKRMRCPNPICREVFDVRDADEPPPLAEFVVPEQPPPVPPPLRAGNVGEVVPILRAEVASPPKPEKKPPPIPPSHAAPKVQPELAANVSLAAAPVSTAVDEFFAGVSPEKIDSKASILDARELLSQDAPPVRQALTGPESNGPTVLPSPVFSETSPQVSPRHSWHWSLLVLALVLIASIGAGLWLIRDSTPNDEADRIAKAEKEYKDRNFADASALYQSLAEDFPGSEQRPVFQFMAQLSQLRDSIHRIQADQNDTIATLHQLNGFFKYYQSDPLLKKHREEIAESSYRLVEEMSRFAQIHKKRELLDDAKTLREFADKQFQQVDSGQSKSIDAVFAVAEAEIVKAENRRTVVSQLEKYLEEPSLEAVEKAPLLCQKYGLANDPEVKRLLDELPARHLKSILFSDEFACESTRPVPGDGAPSIAVVTSRGQRPILPGNAGTRPVFALVRGVLYAIDPSIASLRWCYRVGVDSKEMPVWVPATASTPPLVLIAAAEATSLQSDGGKETKRVAGLLALNGDDGSPVWCQILRDPYSEDLDACAGQPLVFQNRILLASRGGLVLEIDIHDGKCLGGYDLGEELSHGGVLHAGTNYAYFTANRGCVFALDVVERNCQRILYSGHSCGSLLCPPVVIPLSRGDVFDPSKAGPPPAQLLLSLSDGTGKTQLQGFALPLTEAFARPISFGQKNQHGALTGRVWYAPFCNPELVSLVTDAGALTVFGVQHHRESEKLVALLPEALSLSVKQTGYDRPLVAYADSQDIWVLAQGRLHRFQAGISAQEGWRIVERPPIPGLLGSAVHGAQVMADDHGSPMLYLVTESPNGKACWMTAVDLQRNEIHWQLQVGAMAAKPPLVMDEKVWMFDQAGELLVFDQKASVKIPSSSWEQSGRVEIKEWADAAWLLPHKDEKTLSAVMIRGLQARVWKHSAAAANQIGGPFQLDGKLAGAPVLVGERIVAPSSTGRLKWIGAAVPGGEQDWRAKDVDKGAVGYAMAIGPDKLICSDGNKGLMLWRLDVNGLTQVSIQAVKNRITGVTALPSTNGKGSEVRICVADADHNLWLMEGDKLQVVRSWSTSYPITAGPFVRGNLIVAVAGGRRLIWIDPAQAEVQGFSFNADIVGEPQLIDGKLIVADESGWIQALDPVTRQLAGVGYRLQANVAPVAAPIPYGTDRLFVPISDGTVLLPSRVWFRPTFLGLPIRR